MKHPVAYSQAGEKSGLGVEDGEKGHGSKMRHV
jgi:hypothetical protein